MKKFHDDDYEKCDAVLEIAARFIHQVGIREVSDERNNASTRWWRREN